MGTADIIGLILFYTLALALFIALIVFVIKYKSPTARGKRGERKVTKMLLRIQKQCGGYVINDIVLPIGQTTTQIDHIYISSKGIFVIETKNYSGRIYGDESSRYWKQVLANGNTKHKMYNPLMQNETHASAVRKLVFSWVPVISMVVFVQGNIHCIKSNRVFSIPYAESVIVSQNDFLNNGQVDDVYTKIARANLNSRK